MHHVQFAAGHYKHEHKQRENCYLSSSNTIVPHRVCDQVIMHKSMYCYYKHYTIAEF